MQRKADGGTDYSVQSALAYKKTLQSKEAVVLDACLSVSALLSFLRFYRLLLFCTPDSTYGYVYMYVCVYTYIYTRACMPVDSIRIDIVSP